MGKALYRTHRSTSFDDVIGQRHITDTLKSAITSGAVSHAYLFTGPKGVGKTSVARILAHAVNGLEYSSEATHLDIVEIDAASNRRIDEIRELRDKAHIAPADATYKVYIIDEVHMLTREAFNALLKTLEEPPEHAIFILATTELHKVPDTIVSRTQRFNFKPITHDDAVQQLRAIAKKEGIVLHDNALALIAQHGRGSFRDSISTLDQLSGLGKSSYDEDDVRMLLGIPPDDIVRNIIDAVASNDTPALFDHVQSLREQGIDTTQAARAMSQSLRDQLLEQAPQIPSKTIIRILQKLLPLTNTSHDYLALELALLEGIDSSGAQPTVTKPKPVAPPPQKPAESRPKASKPKPKPEPEPETKPVKPTPKPAAPPKPEPTIQASGDWKVLLEDIKGHHNTLYGILRMANADHNGDELTLTFNFGFHQKRIDSPQNSKTLVKYITKHYGSGVQLKTVVKKQPTKSASAAKPAPKQPPADDQNITSVSDVFGGAELLE